MVPTSTLEWKVAIPVKVTGQVEVPPENGKKKPTPSWGGLAVLALLALAGGKKE